MKTHKERVQSLTKAIKSEDVIIKLNRDDNHIKVYLNTNIDIDEYSKLIEAAPKLLKALQMLIKHELFDIERNEPSNLHDSTPGYQSNQLKESLESAKNAIKKATL